MSSASHATNCPSGVMRASGSRTRLAASTSLAPADRYGLSVEGACHEITVSRAADGPPVVSAKAGEIGTTRTDHAAKARAARLAIILQTSTRQHTKTPCIPDRVQSTNNSLSHPFVRANARTDLCHGILHRIYARCLTLFAHRCSVHDVVVRVVFDGAAPGHAQDQTSGCSPPP